MPPGDDDDEIRRERIAALTRLVSESDGLSESTVLLDRPFVPATGRKRVSLIILRGKDVGHEFPLGAERVMLGRDPRLEIPIEDEMASRRHALVTAVGGEADRRYVIRDLESTNGTLVNNRKISEVELRDGDRVVLGETILLYRVLDEIDIDYQEQIRKLIHYHDLTGFLTLKELYRLVRRGLQRAEHGPSSFSLLMVDVDNLKEINTLYGHLAGSTVIRRIGEVFRAVLVGDQAVGIYGGDEFICYLPDTTAETGHGVAERLRTAVETDELRFDGTRLPVTVCVGVAQFPGHGATIQELVRAADKALYRAKALGRNRTVTFEGDG